MRNIHIFFLTILGILAFASCSDDEDPKIGSEFKAPVLNNLLPNNLIITEETSPTDNVADWTWSSADFGIPTEITYTVEADTLGGSFEKPITITSSTSTSVPITAGMLNKTAADFITESTFITLDIRLKTTISNMIEPIYSNVEPITFKAFIAVKSPLYIIGDALVGWDNAPAKIGEDLQVFFSDNSNAANDVYTYTGLFFFKANSGMKFPTLAGNWDTAYGFADGKLIPSNGGGNMSGPASDGVYTLTLNLKDLSATLEPYTGDVKTYAQIGIIGSATPSGWEEDTQMREVVPHVWVTKKVNLIEGEIKFRANGDWADDWGAESSSTQVLPFSKGKYKGENIKVDSEGEYFISLNSLTGHYTVIKTEKLPK